MIEDSLVIAELVAGPVAFLVRHTGKTVAVSGEVRPRGSLSIDL